MKGIEHTGQVGTESVGMIVEGGRHQTHHVERHHALALGCERESGIGIVGIGGQRYRELLPLARNLTGYDSFCIDLRARSIRDSCAKRSLKLALGPERQPIAAALNGIDAPEAFVGNTRLLTLAAFEGHLKGGMLGRVEKLLTDKTQAGTRCALAYRRPMVGRMGIVLEGTIAHELGVETAVGCMVDVLVEDSVQCGGNIIQRMSHVDAHRHLCLHSQGYKHHSG